MLPLRFRRTSGAALLGGVLALAACSDRPGPVAMDEPRGPGGPAELARLTCTATPRARTVTCATPSGLGSDARGLIVGGQNQYVTLASSNVSYLVGDNVFSFDVTVQNLIPQPMGTADGTTPSAEGVRVIFHSGPSATVGSGEVSLINEDGTGTFTGSGQAYYQYAGNVLGGDGILSQNETSDAKTWELTVEPTVEQFAFVLYVVADVPFPNGYVDVTPAADTLAAGGTTSLTAVVRSAVGNVIPGQTVTWGTSDAGVATVDAAGLVTGVAPGMVTINATSGARSGSATIAVCADLSLAAVAVFSMPEGSSLCLAGGGDGAEYTLVPVNVSEAGSVSLGVTGAGIVPVSGPPTPSRAAGGFSPRASGAAGRGLARDGRFETRLRLRERAELTGKMGPARAAFQRSAARGGARRAITPGVPSVGALMSLNVETDNFCSTFDTRTGRVVAVGTRVIVVADTTNPAGGLTAANYQAIADSFDAKVWPAVTGGFDDPSTPANDGIPGDIDGNGRVIAFYTRAVNELAPPSSSSYVGGFFTFRDLLPATECPTSNVGEMVYMLAADPAGAVNGNARSVAAVMEETLGTLAHELQHLVNASRRLYVNGAPEMEEVWLDEGLSHVAEELMFYQGSGLAPGEDLDLAAVADGGVRQDAFFKYQEANFARLRQWLLAPHASGPFQGDDDLATRGAAWAFLRYAVDRLGVSQPAFFATVMNGQDAGLANLGAALGTDPLPWFGDFAAAMYVDDATGTSPAAEYLNPSWDYRSLYAALDYDPGPACSCAFELAVRNPANGVTDTFTLAGGGAAAYLRMGVSANAFAGVTVRSGSVAPPSTVRLAVVRRE